MCSLKTAIFHFDIGGDAIVFLGYIKFTVNSTNICPFFVKFKEGFDVDYENYVINLT